MRKDDAFRLIEEATAGIALGLFIGILFLVLHLA